MSRSYGRVSRIGERGKVPGKELLSPSLQIESGEAYFARLGVPFDKQGSIDNGDWDESAFDRPWKDRPGIVRHYNDARAGRLTDLSFYLLSRLGRDLAESLDLIAAFESVGCLLHFPNEGITPNISSGMLDSGAKLLRNIRLALAESESEDKRLWALSAARKRCEGGKPMGELPQWIERTEDGSYTLRPSQSAAVQEMARLRIGGMGYASIAREVNTMGYRTLSGSLFMPPVVRKYLTGSYIDTLLGASFFNRDLPEGDPERIRIENCFPPVITETQARYLRALETVTARGSNRRMMATSFLLTGKIFCGHCGKAMVGKDGGRANRVYKCWGCIVNTDAPGNKSISGKEVEEGVLRAIRYAIKYTPTTPPRRKTAVPGAKDALEKLKTRRRRLLQLHLQEMVSEEDYLSEKAGIDRQIEAIEAREKQEDRETALSLASTISIDASDTAAYSRALVLLLIESVTVPADADIPESWDRRARRGARESSRRCARILLTAPVEPGGPREIYAPLYGNAWKGAKGLYRLSEEGGWESIAVTPDT